MNIEQCALGNCNSLKEKIGFALLGVGCGFLGMKLWSERDRITAIRRMRRNKGKPALGHFSKATRSGLAMTVDGMDYFILVEGMPEGSYAVWVARPYATKNDFVGIVEKAARGFRVYPPDKYGFGVKTDLPSFIIKKGTLLRSLRKAVGYLGKPYMRAFRKSRAYKDALGRQFSRELRP